MKKYRKMQSQPSVFSEQYLDQNNEGLFNFSDENQEASQFESLKLQDDLTYQKMKESYYNQQQQSNLLFIIKVTYCWYAQDDHRLKKVLQNDESLNDRKTSQIIADFMRDVPPTIKLFRTFILYFYPKWSSITFSVCIQEVFYIFQDMNTLSFAKLQYNQEKQNQILQRYKLIFQQTNKTTKNVQLSGYHQILSHQFNQNRYINYMNFLVWLESLNFYEDEENFLSKNQIYEAIREFSRHIKIQQKNIAVNLVKVLEFIWHETIEYLTSYCATGTDGNPRSQEGQTFVDKLYKRRFLHEKQELQRYKKFSKNFQGKTYSQGQNVLQPGLAPEKQIFQLSFIRQFLPEILYKIVQTYKRLQLQKRAFIKLKEYAPFIRDFNRLTMTLYEIVKFINQNLHEHLDLIKILRDTNFLFNVHEKGIVSRIIKKGFDRIVDTKPSYPQSQKPSINTDGQLQGDSLKSHTSESKVEVTENQQKPIVQQNNIRYYGFLISEIDKPRHEKLTDLQYCYQKMAPSQRISFQSVRSVDECYPYQINHLSPVDLIRTVKQFSHPAELEEQSPYLNDDYLGQNQLVQKKMQTSVFNKFKQIFKADKMGPDQNFSFRGFVDASQFQIFNSDSAFLETKSFVDSNINKIDVKGVSKIEESINSYDIDEFDIKNGKPLAQNDIQSQVPFIQSIIDQLIVQANQLAFHSSNLFKLVLMFLQQVSALTISVKIYHQFNKPCLSIRDKQKVQSINTIIHYYINYIASAQCEVDPCHKNQLIQDLIAELFEFFVIQRITDTVKMCENHLKVNSNDEKRQMFYFLIADMYQMVFPQIADKYCHKIKQTNIFGMSSKYGIRQLTQLSILKQSNVLTQSSGQQLLYTILDDLIEQLTQSLPLKPGQNEIFHTLDKLKLKDLEETAYCRTELSSTSYSKKFKSLRQKPCINLVIFRKIQFYFVQLIDFAKIDHYFRLIKHYVSVLSLEGGKIFTQKDQMLFLSLFKGIYFNKLAIQIQRFVLSNSINTQNLISRSSSKGSKSVKQRECISENNQNPNKLFSIQLSESQQQLIGYFCAFQSQLINIQQLIGFQTNILNVPQYYWQIKSQLIKYKYCRTVYLIYLDQFFLNSQYFERSLSKFILGKLNINSFSVQITQIFLKDKQVKNHISTNNKDANGFYHQTFIKQQAIDQNYPIYFPLNFYYTYLNVLFQVNQKRYLERQQIQQFLFDNKICFSVQQLFSSTSLFSLDSHYRLSSFIKYLQKNQFQTVLVSADTIPSQVLYLEGCLVYCEFDAICNHLNILIRQLQRYNPFQNTAVNNVVVRIIHEFVRVNTNKNMPPNKMDSMSKFADFILNKHIQTTSNKEITKQNHSSIKKTSPQLIYFQLIVIYKVLKQLYTSPTSNLSHPRSLTSHEVIQKYIKYFLNRMSCFKRMMNDESCPNTFEIPCQMIYKQEKITADTYYIHPIPKEFAQGLKSVCSKFVNKFMKETLSDEVYFSKKEKTKKISLKRRLSQPSRNDWTSFHLLEKSKENNCEQYKLHLKNKKSSCSRTYIMSKINSKLMTLIQFQNRLLESVKPT